MHVTFVYEVFIHAAKRHISAGLCRIYPAADVSHVCQSEKGVSL